MKALGVLLLAFQQTAMAADGDSLGRLFFTPEQRLLLDRQRRFGATYESGSSAVQLDGTVTRTRGKPTTWINGRSLDQDRDETVVFGVPLRVGESLDPATRQKTDIVPDGSISRSGARHGR